MRDRTAERLALVRAVARRGIDDPRVLDALAGVPREEFTPVAVSRKAYEDLALPIDEGQTISQPLVVALMCQGLDAGPGARVLEVGTGSGYGAAVLAQLFAEVHTVERLPGLATSAAARLAHLGLAHVHVHVGDGTLGWADAMPFDAIVVTAAGPEVPSALLAQLRDGGQLVIPVGPSAERQRLLRLTRRGGAIEREDLGAVQFVPLIGAQAWNPGEGRW